MWKKNHRRFKEIMKKNFKFYALIAVLLVGALLYFGNGGELSQQEMELGGQIVDMLLDSGSDASAAPAEQVSTVTDETEPEDAEDYLDEHGSYDQPEDVALYIHTYGRLPDNYITKSQAEKLGWEGGSVERYAPGKCIGGSRFGNREGILPSAKGRTWTECDINTLGKSSRGAERIVFSNDGLIYYTDDHYESFTLLYGEP